jgi:hypothetical protein
MSEAERWRRPELTRDQPIRDFMTYVRKGGMGSDSRDAGNADKIEDPVARGVNLGYSVVEEQIRQGERLAERLRSAQSGPGAKPLDFGALIERALNVYKDVGALALAAAETLARNPSVQAGVARAWRGAAASDAPAAPGGFWPFALELNSSRRVTVRLELRPRPERFAPRVRALHPVSAAAPPLTSARFETDSASVAPVLRIDIEDSQPADVYSGVVVEATTNEPCGTLSVRILS